MNSTAKNHYFEQMLSIHSPIRLTDESAMPTQHPALSKQLGVASLRFIHAPQVVIIIHDRLVDMQTAIPHGSPGCRANRSVCSKPHPLALEVWE